MRHRETAVFSCGPQTGKDFILEITLRLAEGLCKIKGNFLLIHTTAYYHLFIAYRLDRRQPVSF